MDTSFPLNVSVSAYNLRQMSKKAELNILFMFEHTGRPNSKEEGCGDVGAGMKRSYDMMDVGISSRVPPIRDPLSEGKHITSLLGVADM